MTFTRFLSSKSSFQKYSVVLDYVNESREFERRVKEELMQHFYDCLYEATSVVCRIFLIDYPLFKSLNSAGKIITFYRTDGHLASCLPHIYETLHLHQSIGESICISQYKAQHFSSVCRAKGQSITLIFLPDSCKNIFVLHK